MPNKWVHQFNNCNKTNTRTRIWIRFRSFAIQLKRIESSRIRECEHEIKSSTMITFVYFPSSTSSFEYKILPSSIASQRGILHHPKHERLKMNDQIGNHHCYNLRIATGHLYTMHFTIISFYFVEFSCGCAHRHTHTQLVKYHPKMSRSILTIAKMSAYIKYWHLDIRMSMPEVNNDDDLMAVA